MSENSNSTDIFANQSHQHPPSSSPATKSSLAEPMEADLQRQYERARTTASVTGRTLDLLLALPTEQMPAGLVDELALLQTKARVARRALISRLRKSEVAPASTSAGASPEGCIAALANDGQPARLDDATGAHGDDDGNP